MNPKRAVGQIYAIGGQLPKSWMKWHTPFRLVGESSKHQSAWTCRFLHDPSMEDVCHDNALADPNTAYKGFFLTDLTSLVIPNAPRELGQVWTHPSIDGGETRFKLAEQWPTSWRIDRLQSPLIHQTTIADKNLDSLNQGAVLWTNADGSPYIYPTRATQQSIDLSRYPHVCPRYGCGAPAYIGYWKVECSRGC